MRLLAVLTLAAFLSFAGLGQGQGPEKAKFPESPKDALAAARWLEKAYAGSPQPEAVRMLLAIADGSWLKPDGGWFGPCQTRYTWDWLARHHDHHLHSGDAGGA